MKITNENFPKSCGSCRYHDWDEYGDKTDFCVLNGMTLTGYETEVDKACPLRVKVTLYRGLM